MSELVEPNPLLIEYYIKANTLASELNKDTSSFKELGEWHYIESNIEYNIYLLKRLYEAQLLQPKVNICDCGIGLATIMYDFYLQSKEIPLDFNFYGVEKWKPYYDSFNDHLSTYWNGDLTIYNCDITEHNYSSYNFIWIFTPFNIVSKLLPFFEKVIDEMPPGGIVIGIDHFRVMSYGSESLKEKFLQLQRYKLDEIWVLKKPD